MKSKKIFESSGYELFFSSNPSQVVILNVILIIQDSNVSEIILKMFNFEQYEPVNTK